MGPMKSVRMWLESAALLSSNVRMKRLLWSAAHRMYGSRLSFSHVSPRPIESECMSLRRLGITNETVGSESYRSDAGKWVYGRLLSGGTFEKLDHGLWRRR